jgi:hypothetical protein
MPQIKNKTTPTSSKGLREESQAYGGNYFLGGPKMEKNWKMNLGKLNFL